MNAVFRCNSRISISLRKGIQIFCAQQMYIAYINVVLSHFGVLCSHARNMSILYQALNDRSIKKLIAH